MSRKALQVLLVKRPIGKVDESSFELKEIELPPLEDGKVLVEVQYLSVDPAMRPMMVEGRDSYVQPFELNKPLHNTGIFKVVESRSPHFNNGDILSTRVPWQDYQVWDGETLKKANPRKLDSANPAYLGLLGMNGMTAYFGLTEIGKPKANETLLVSAAAGATGAVVGQIGKILGLKVVGIAGGDDKVEYLVKELGFDKAINYKKYITQDNKGVDEMSAAIKEACPSGVDIYFENVGGPILDAVLLNMNNGGRLPFCGQITSYETNPEHVYGIKNLWRVVAKRLHIEGFIVSDFISKFGEALPKMVEWYKAGQLKDQVYQVDGLQNAVKALQGLFTGANVGKTIIKVK